MSGQACTEVFVGFDGARTDCNLLADHSGRHESKQGTYWSNPGPTASARPSAVRVGPLHYRILWDAEEVSKFSAGADTGDGEWVAFSDHEALVIGLNPNHADDSSKMSLLHEILHCVLRVSGAWPNSYARLMSEARDRDGGVTVEEYTVAATAAPLLGVLRDNPVALKWLLT